MGKLKLELNANSKSELIAEMDKLKKAIETADLTKDAVKKIHDVNAWAVSYDT
ncbi:hypothetical protein J7444_08285 [Labrenzia sp. R4_1]|uniref:hypothetical protein n=1 Tax=Labrenzia sp. R4_1 TaxID=2821106 RepID=UPI001ADB0560|nr:hypothetical protein [Labrenzia sp. R4_1]MBO9424716.1 hypothetical protein [Labrenzia sp. R4_1]